MKNHLYEPGISNIFEFKSKVVSVTAILFVIGMPIALYPGMSPSLINLQAFSLAIALIAVCYLVGTLALSIKDDPVVAPMRGFLISCRVTKSACYAIGVISCLLTKSINPLDHLYIVVYGLVIFFLSFIVFIMYINKKWFFQWLSEASVGRRAGLLIPLTLSYVVVMIALQGNPLA